MAWKRVVFFLSLGTVEFDSDILSKYPFKNVYVRTWDQLNKFVRPTHLVCVWERERAVLKKRWAVLLQSKLLFLSVSSCCSKFEWAQNCEYEWQLGFLRKNRLAICYYASAHFIGNFKPQSFLILERVFLFKRSWLLKYVESLVKVLCWTPNGLSPRILGEP